MNRFIQHKPYIIAGPCSAENESQMLEIAAKYKSAPVHMIRAGIWKPRTKPGFFEGMGEQALPWLQQVKKISNKPVCIEVAGTEQVELALRYDVDAVWIGARSTVSPFIVQEIIDAVNGTNLSLLIKNPITPDIDLWLGAIERALNAGIENLAAIHRGFSSYDKRTQYRNKPNWALPIELKRRFPDLPIICDPSHITGKRDLVAEVAQKALDLNFDGLMIETHPNPDSALSDAAQQIRPDELLTLLKTLIVRNQYSQDQEALDKIEALREAIDTLDAEFVDLLAKRMDIVKELAVIKKQHNISVFQPERWTEILKNRTLQAQTLHLSDTFIKKLYEIIHDYSIKSQLEILNK